MNFSEYVSLDLEFSTGGDKKGTPPKMRKCSIVEIGAVRVTETEFTPRLWIVKLIPGRAFQTDAPEACRKDPKKYENRVDPKVALEELREFIGYLPVVGFDIGRKDMPHIMEHREFLGLPEWHPRVVFDLKSIYDTSLDKLAQQFGIYWFQTHEGLDGALLTGACFEAFNLSRGGAPYMCSKTGLITRSYFLR